MFGGFDRIDKPLGGFKESKKEIQIGLHLLTYLCEVGEVDISNDVFRFIRIWKCIKNLNMIMIVDVKLLGVFDNLVCSCNFFWGGIAFVDFRQLQIRELLSSNQKSGSQTPYN
jgi:hypothetical protein